jgi:thiamine-phosphate pyrophosphorylase
MAARVPRLLAISDRRFLAERYGPGSGAFEAWLRQLADAGVDAVELREKELSDRRLLELTRLARRLLPDTLILVNGRVDVALAGGADGVHLPAAGLPVAPLRRRFGRGVVIGRSTHHPEEVAEARRAGADYVTFGPVHPTPSKAAYGPPPGLDGLRRAAAHGLPVVALGGVGPEAVAEALAAGAAGVAGIRAFHDPDSLRRLRAAVEVAS